MPGPYVTANGFTPPTIESLVVDMVDDQRAEMDPLIDTDAEEVLGQLNGAVASQLREAYEVLLVAYNAFDPLNVDDARVDALCAITGTKRQGATRSKFTGSRRLEVGLNASTTLPAGTLFEVEGAPLVKFETTEEVVSTTAGLYYVSAQAVEAGRVICNANTLTVITTPVVGLNSVNNPTDAIIGKEADTPEELLVRREDEIAGLGGCNVDAIRAELLAYEVDGTKPVLEATVFENDTDFTDGLGLPPHSIECLIYDGLVPTADNDAIAQVIWDSKPSGTKTFGTTSGTAVDQKGVERTVHFSRVSTIGIDVEVTLNINADNYVGVQAVRNAWKAYVDGIPSGAVTEVRWSVAIREFLKLAGVEGCETIRLRRHGSSYLSPMTDLSLGAREKSFADASASYVTVLVG